MFERQNLKKTPRIAFQVTDHALERFRERVEEEFVHRSNDDLADLLNARISSAVRSANVVDPRAPDKVTTLYLFECRTGKSLVAVVRDQHVITVLDDYMARTHYPGWDGSPTAGLGTIGSTVIGSKLRDVVPVVPVPPSVLPRAPESDAYLVLAAECRALAAKMRALREQKSLLETQLIAATEALQRDEAEFATKRERLLTLMTDGES
jgi:hypothetical protein